MRAVQHLGVEHPPHLDVVDECGIAFGQLDGIYLALRLADNLGFGNFRAGHDAGRQRVCRFCRVRRRP